MKSKDAYDWVKFLLQLEDFCCYYAILLIDSKLLIDYKQYAFDVTLKFLGLLKELP